MCQRRFGKRAGRLDVTRDIVLPALRARLRQVVDDLDALERLSEHSRIVVRALHDLDRHR